MMYAGIVDYACLLLLMSDLTHHEHGRKLQTWIHQLWNELSELKYASWPSMYQDQRNGILL